MVVVGEGEAKLVVHVDHGSAGPWREPYLSWLRRTAALGLDHGGMVLVVDKGRTTLMLPDRGVDLGIVGDDDRIVLAEVANVGARTWEATVMKKDAAEHFAARVAKDQRESEAGENGQPNKTSER